MLEFSALAALAEQAGLDEVGVSIAGPAIGVREAYRAWIESGYQGQMAYLERNFDKRMDPTLLVPGARSVVSALLSYNIPLDPEMRAAPKVARYAWLRDYHFILKERLFALLAALRNQCGEVNGRVFVDSAPFLDRYWAVRAGLGWIGRNSLLISPRLGSFLFIGSLVIDLPIEPSEKTLPTRCGSCNACLTACPTGALLAPGLMDANRCIAYLTIEKKDPLTPAEEASLDGWAFGCDACQNACPWNRKPSIASLQKEIIISRELLRNFALGNAPLPKDSPMTRANPDRLRHLLLK